MSLTPDFPAYLRDHQVGGRIIAPGPLIIEIAQACAAAEFGERPRAVKDFDILAPIVVGQEGARVHVALAAETFAVHVRTGEGDWTRCATGRFDEAAPAARPAIDLGALQKRLRGDVDLEAHHQALLGLGVTYGPSFRLVERAWRGKDEALAKIVISAHASAFAYPPALDAALHAIGLSSETPELRLFSGLETLWLAGEPPATFFAHATLNRSRGEAESRAEVRLYDEAGRQIGALNGVVLRRASAGAFDPLCYRVDSIPVGAAAASSTQLPSPADCASAAEAAFAALAETHHLWRHHDDLGAHLDRLTLLHVAEALRSLGFDDALGRHFEVAAEVGRLGVADRHVRTFRKIIDLLVGTGVCARDGDGQRPSSSGCPSRRPIPSMLRSSNASIRRAGSCASSAAAAVRWPKLCAIG